MRGQIPKWPWWARKICDRNVIGFIVWLICKLILTFLELPNPIVSDLQRHSRRCGSFGAISDEDNLGNRVCEGWSINFKLQLQGRSARISHHSNGYLMLISNLKFLRIMIPLCPALRSSVVILDLTALGVCDAYESRRVGCTPHSSITGSKVGDVLMVIINKL